MTGEKGKSPTGPMSLQDKKWAARTVALGHRDSLSAEAIGERSALIQRNLLKLDVYQNANTLLFYASFRSEVKTEALIRSLLAQGKVVLLPRVGSPPSLQLYRITDLARDTQISQWGIPEPDPARCELVDPASVDVAIVPGVAFDRNCNRVGYGGGFYDSLIPALSPKAAKIALAFMCQLLESVPVGDRDQPVDAIVTEAGVIWRDKKP